VKIFTSYSRSDAREFAELIRPYLMGADSGVMERKRKIDVFTDIANIKPGEVWTKSVATNISNCDIFVVIVTYGALDSPHVDNEVLQAQREEKTIIPCFYEELEESERAKWGLNEIQGVEFEDKSELALRLFSKILEHANVLYEKGNALQSSGEHEKAIKSFDKALEIKPKNANAWNN
jgi:tetratricopeptide (TPR) repeat protein